MSSDIQVKVRFLHMWFSNQNKYIFIWPYQLRSIMTKLFWHKLELPFNKKLISTPNWSKWNSLFICRYWLFAYQLLQQSWWNLSQNLSHLAMTLRDGEKDGVIVDMARNRNGQQVYWLFKIFNFSNNLNLILWNDTFVWQSLYVTLK